MAPKAGRPFTIASVMPCTWVHSGGMGQPGSTSSESSPSLSAPRKLTAATSQTRARREESPVVSTSIKVKMASSILSFSMLSFIKDRAAGRLQAQGTVVNISRPKPEPACQRYAQRDVQL